MRLHSFKNLLPLFLASFTALYTEIMLIRWIGTEVRVFAYFQNLALITSFLGFGIGFYWSKRTIRPFIITSLVALTMLVVLIQPPLMINKIIDADWLSLSSDVVLWGFTSSSAVAGFLGSFIGIVILLLLIILVMIPLGQLIGFYLDKASNAIQAYSVDLIGSVSGICLLTVLSFFWLPPQYWFFVTFLLFSILIYVIKAYSRNLLLLSIALLAIIGFAFHSRVVEGTATYWSPYQKLTVVATGEEEYRIQVNNTFYMSIANRTADYLLQHPEVTQTYQTMNSYDAPFQFSPYRDRVLIVGAGAGNDAAAALRNGVGHIDAVEIDPVIYALGEKLHPEKPYQSSKVRKVLTDARSFMRQAEKQQYDVIIFGLLDSHTQFSNYSNVRIDNYVYTEEALREAQSLLKPNGILVLKFEVREPWTWIGQRFYHMFKDISGYPPVVFYVPSVKNMASATIFVTSGDENLLAQTTTPELAQYIADNPPSFPLGLLKEAPAATTDDWPYVYHKSRSIPKPYLTISVILLTIALLFVRRVFNVKKNTTWLFFFLGAGFLLLETQMVSRLALYFGSTWIVNSIVITATLLMLVIANAYVTYLRPAKLLPYYFLLITSLIANYAFPWEQLPYSILVVGIFITLTYAFSIFLTGIIFTETFRRCADRSGAFGANIIGAVTGGLTQNLSFILGMKSLLVVAAIFYVLAAVSTIWATKLSPQKK